MPYRARGVWVYVKRGSKWVRLKRHPTATKAKKHATALNINVAAKEG